MEDISKQQVILISLLVAIVTAVATSIATVSLTNESSTPQQTIYRVIEQSIQKVADLPAVTKNSDIPVTPKGPSILSPADIASKVAPSVVRIYKKEGDKREFVALGVASGSKGGVIDSTRLVPHVEGTLYFAISNNNKEIPVTYTQGDIQDVFSFFVLNYEAGEKNKIPAINLSNISGVKLGSNVVAFGGKEAGDVISNGIVTEIRSIGSNASSTKDILVTDMALSSTISGFLLFDTLGNLIAFEKGLDEVDKTPFFINASILKTDLAKVL